MRASILSQLVSETTGEVRKTAPVRTFRKLVAKAFGIPNLVLISDILKVVDFIDVLYSTIHFEQ